MDNGTGGSKRVEVVAKDDERQITAAFAASFTGEFLLLQLVYQDKTEWCLPQFQFPPDWNITFSPNHWSNELTIKEYFEQIILPYINKKQEHLKLIKNHPALLVFDNFKAQRTKDLLTFLDDKNMHVVLIPANCTDKLQPLDLVLTKLPKIFSEVNPKIGSYAQEICSQLQEEAEGKAVDLRLSVVKPLVARWTVPLYDYIKAKPDIVCSGFKEAGIANSLNTDE